LKTVAFIFARGGSKGLVGKNIKLLNGKPLLQYSIDIAKSISQISDIFVSTDCPEIASVAKQDGVRIIHRPKELAKDSSPEFLAWKHACDFVKSNYGSFDYFVSLPTTSPLRSADDVVSALQKLEQTSADICISVTPASRSPYFNMIEQHDDGLVNLVIKSDLGDIIRRQDVPTVFDITTVVYAADVSFIEKESSIFSGNVVAIEVPKKRAVDIDDIYDFKFAEVLLKNGS
jgi:N-acylneuraminate cytidylyltransferase